MNYTSQNCLKKTVLKKRPYSVNVVFRIVQNYGE